MMSIIGWATMIYIFIGCMFTIVLYTVIDHYDEFDSWMSECYDDIFKRYRVNISYEMAVSYITVTLIFNWVLAIVIAVYCEISSSKKDEA